MNNYYPTTSSHPSMPQTLDDFILLFNALKEKHGNMDVKISCERDIDSPKEWAGSFDDIRLYSQNNQSLVNDYSVNNVSTTLLFVMD